MSKADDVFWRQFGVVPILLAVFGFAMYFVANSIGDRAYAEMHGNPDAVVARIAPVGRSRIGDPAAQTASAAPAASAARVEAASAARVEVASAARVEVAKSETAPATPEAGAASAEGQVVAAAAGPVDLGPVDLVAGEKVYQSACFACHLSGVADAPKLDDPAAWEPRLAQGMSGLVQAAVNGKGAMPPKGGFAHLTEDDLRNAVGFMLDKAGVSAGG